MMKYRTYLPLNVCVIARRIAVNYFVNALEIVLLLKCNYVCVFALPDLLPEFSKFSKGLILRKKMPSRNLFYIQVWPIQ